MSCRLFRHERQSGMIPPAPSGSNRLMARLSGMAYISAFWPQNGSLARPTPPGRCAGKSEYPPTQYRFPTIDKVLGLPMDRTSLVSADHSF